jgi:hypothetical protein
MRLPLVIGPPDESIVAKDDRPDLINYCSRFFNGLETITAKTSVRSDDLSAAEYREICGTMDFTAEACPENGARSSRPRRQRLTRQRRSRVAVSGPGSLSPESC